MKQRSADAKHAILLEYRPRSQQHSLAALARRHNIAGAERTLHNWLQRWDGTAASLMHRRGAGRPRILTRAEVKQCLHAPLLAANRAHRAIHYTDMLPQVQRETRSSISLRSLRRYGKKELRAKNRKTTKRTQLECQCNSHTHACVAAVAVEQHADFACSGLSNV